MALWGWDVEDMRAALYEEGIERGIERGVERGREQGREETARNLKKMGLSIAQIAEGTGLSPEAIASM